MRIKISFRVLAPNSLLPLSYQYELSSWIYKRIESSDANFSQFLHSKGYVAEGKKFKLFTFSNLEIANGKAVALNGSEKKDRLLIRSREISLIVSFLVDKAAEHLIMGLFQDQELQLGDKKSSIRLRVNTVEMLKIPEISPKMRFRTLSPLLISRPYETNKDKHKYLSPSDEDYAHYFLKNLLDKQKAAFSNGLCEGSLNLNFQFRLLSPQVKSRLVTIKAHTPAQTKIRGYLFQFELEADPELLRIGYLAGFGGNSSQGFGCVGV